MISPDAPEIKIFINVKELAREVADLIDARIRRDLKVNNVFHLALTGGTLGILISEILVSHWNIEPQEFVGLHLWWGDERFVPELSIERNAFPVITGLAPDSPIHIHQVLASDAGGDLEIAARRYNADLFGIDMNLTILGVGPDGHVASLFPGLWEQDEERNAIPVKASPKPPRERVSFSMFKINSSSAVWLVASGAEKRRAIKQIIARDASIPASFVHAREETLLFADLDASAGE